MRVEQYNSGTGGQGAATTGKYRVVTSSEPDNSEDTSILENKAKLIRRA